MEIEPNFPITYPDWFADWKKRIQSAQIEQQLVTQNTNQIVQQPAAQLYPFGNEHYTFFDLVPWGHHQLVLDKCKFVKQSLFYLQKTVENNWSRDTTEELKRELDESVQLD